jgi:hypothetical protein
MRANAEKVRAREQAVSAKIIALLTPAQKKALPGLLRESDLMRVVGLPPELAQSLKLTAAQKRTIAEYAKAHPRREGDSVARPAPRLKRFVWTRQRYTISITRLRNYSIAWRQHYHESIYT